MDSLVAKKAFAFAVRIVKAEGYLKDRSCPPNLRSQLLRCGTSIGANIEEALEGQSDKDFIAKLSISLKESRECKYWLRLLHDTGFFEKQHFESIWKDACELHKMLSSIIITCKQKQGR
jgi:four helix bundle protein